ncbi:2-hydroxyacid dehydrogenase [Mangrovibacterium lignilyticum]|uniref:2-hydroxyacid dehydrogenase n=1 Tax=Mangrovibacterium lignilyticum TaxID=2668052 RepID=UPI0013D5C452|nr:2-hydroxyacid dehydrogenase [Mangrovibacterium lignilyticum]
MAEAKSKPLIAFFDTKPYDREVFNQLNDDYGYQIKYFQYHITPDNCILAKDADVVVVFVNDIISSDVIDQLAGFGVKLVALRCSGFNNVDLKYAKGKIQIVRVPAYSPNAIAEHTVALMMTLNRKIHRAYFRTRDANFTLNGLMGFTMQGKTAGVIGTGKIGKALVRILRGFDMKVLAYDPYPDEKHAKEVGYSYVDLDSLMQQSDVISLNCPLTRETKWLIDKDAIGMMKKGVMIINTGRGKLIRTTDLIVGLKSGKVGSAGLDVYEEESEFFFEDLSDRVLFDDTLARLLTFNNVIITSHQAFFTREALMNIAGVTLGNIQDFFDGKKLVNEVVFSE